MMLTTALNILMLVGCSLPAPDGHKAEVVSKNDVRLVHFAERVVVVELARDKSHVVRLGREGCGPACMETGSMELAIGLIGLSQSDAALEALVNLLGLKLDGSGSEELTCQVITKGESVSRNLEQMVPVDAVRRCQSIFSELRKRELRDISDVESWQVCRTEGEVRKLRDDLLEAVRSGAVCDF